MSRTVQFADDKLELILERVLTNIAWEVKTMYTMLLMVTLIFQICFHVYPGTVVDQRVEKCHHCCWDLRREERCRYRSIQQAVREPLLLGE